MIGLTAAAALALTACASRTLPAGADGARQPLCADLDGLEGLLEPGVVLVLGEIHGTEEAPAVVSDLVCQALRRSLPVTLALEIPRQESARIEAWLASAGEPEDRDALLAGPFWQSTYQDGRRSEAMAALLDDARRFVADGHAVDVRLLDMSGLSAAAREQAMADALVEAAGESADGLVVTLVGNIHARLARGAPGISDPMVVRAQPWLSARVGRPRRLVTLALSSAGGTAWTCGTGKQGCGPRPFPGTDADSRRYLSVAAEVERGYHGVFHVGAIHASPPAVATVAAATTPATGGTEVAETRDLKRPAAVPRSRSEPHPDGEWPQWMGPDGDGTVEIGLLLRGADIGLAVDWRQPVGHGYSSVTVSRGRALTLEADPRGLWLLALDVVDGGEIWRVPVVSAATSARERVDSPLSTPATDGERVFALGPEGRLLAVGIEDGRSLWSRELKEDFGASPPAYGMSTSPLVRGKRLFVLVGGSGGNNLVVFDKRTGEEVLALDYATQGSYATPVAGDLGGQRQIVIPAGDRIYAVRPGDGSLLWSYGELPFPDRDPLLLSDRRIFFTFQEFAAMLEVTEDGGGWSVRELWRSQQMDSSYSPAVHHRGAIFGFDGPRLTCLDAATGEVAWQTRSGGGSLIRVDDHLVVLRPRAGRLELVPAFSDTYATTASSVIFPGGADSTTPPSFGAGRIFLRAGGEIVAVRPDFSGQSAPESEWPASTTLPLSRAGVGMGGPGERGGG